MSERPTLDFLVQSARRIFQTQPRQQNGQPQLIGDAAQAAVLEWFYAGGFMTALREQLDAVREPFTSLGIETMARDTPFDYRANCSFREQSRRLTLAQAYSWVVRRLEGESAISKANIRRLAAHAAQG